MNIQVKNHLKELSSYNHNLYELNQAYQGCSVAFECCYEDHNYITISFGVVENDKFKQTLPNHYLVFFAGSDQEFEDSDAFTKGKISLSEVAKYLSEHEPF